MGQLRPDKVTHSVVCGYRLPIFAQRVFKIRSLTIEASDQSESSPFHHVGVLSDVRLLVMEQCIIS
jgi:hypothetical protein